MGIDGKKDILGLYLSQSEGANFWLSVLTDLNNRGLEDILIASVDGLKGFPEAIKTIYPNTEVQLCVVHQIRNSLKYISSKDQKEFMRDLKLVYQATTKELAEDELVKLDEKWGKKYPIVLQSWQNKWENLSYYLREACPWGINIQKRLERLCIQQILLNQFIDNLENSLRLKVHFLMRIHF